MRNCVVTETLRIIHAAAVRVLLDEALDAPLEVRRRLLRSTAKVDVVFDFEAPDAVVKAIQFFIDSWHEGPVELRKVSAATCIPSENPIFGTTAHAPRLILDILSEAVTGILTCI